jgi:uncharacterized protein (DUF697 family)
VDETVVVVFVSTTSSVATAPVPSSKVTLIFNVQVSLFPRWQTTFARLVW